MEQQRYVVRSPEDFVRTVAAIRHMHGLTQAQLATQAGMSRASLGQLETGRQGRSVALLLRLLRRLGANITITVGPDDAAS